MIAERKRGDVGLKYIMLHFSYLDQFQLMDDTQIGTLIRLAMMFAKTGVEPDVEDPLVSMAFSFMRGNIERERQAYERRVKASRENGAKGGRPRREQ